MILKRSRRKHSALVGIDLGTSSAKCLAISAEGKSLGRGSAAYPTHTPEPGWLEQEPSDWVRAIRSAVGSCLRQAGLSSRGTRTIAAVGLSGHMSGIICLDRDNRPLHRCILIADTRSHEQTKALRRRHLGRFRKATGNEPFDAFAVSKLLWVKERRPDLFARTRSFLFPKDYVRYLLAGQIATEPTDAANSLLLDLGTRRWNEDLIERAGLPIRIFPPVRESSEVAGRITSDGAAAIGLPAGVPVIMGAADMACSAVGTGAVSPEVLALTLSTSGQVMASVSGFASAAVGKLTFHPHAEVDGLYAMGSIFAGGLSYSWARSVLAGTGDTRKLEREMARVPAGSDGVTFLPFLAGSGTPSFRPADRAAWTGLTAAAGPAVMARAVLEGVAYAVRQNVEVFARAGILPSQARLGGGGSRSRLWAEILASVLERPLEVLDRRDASVFGACLLAAVGAGVFSGVKEAAQELVTSRETVMPDRQNLEVYRRGYRRFRRTCRALAS